jgi:hypothetical protein
MAQHGYKSNLPHPLATFAAARKYQPGSGGDAANQEFVARQSVGISYWEGSVRVRGTQRGKPITGQGYVELTGYDKPFSKTFDVI